MTKMITDKKNFVRSRSPEYSALVNAIHRCHNPEHAAYYNYGARGITVCDEWRMPFDPWGFIQHIGLRPSPLHSLDRIDNDKGYEPGNVRWSDRKTQQYNRRGSLSPERRAIVEEIQRKTGCAYHTAIKRSLRDPANYFAPLQNSGAPKGQQKSRAKSVEPKECIRKRNGKDNSERNRMIRADYDAGEFTFDIAAKYNISPASVGNIIRGKQ